MTIIYQLLRLGVKYGTRFVNWVNANRSRIMGWVRDGLALDAIIARIKQILGIN
ncbi:aureocin A53 family class IId bacteriocin [Propioniciclava sinopodophylli]|uniref:aureocin A53 family class IId bacteriocin n=1 Tax=Propioniciclava sinopodophylli TaxID=1837344 RepID=UPI0024907297|nr:aureocin A53 family class IId bacteriocin [Propioniciclava sinopodophylli]